jgi:hypothetical protein
MWSAKRFIAGSALVLAMFGGSQNASADVTLQARFIPSGDVSRYRVLAGAAVVLDAPATQATSCGTATCLGPFPLGEDGIVTSYSVQACDEIGRCATSNVVPFRVPLAPGVSNLVIELRVVP